MDFEFLMFILFAQQQWLNTHTYKKADPVCFNLTSSVFVSFKFAFFYCLFIGNTLTVHFFLWFLLSRYSPSAMLIHRSVFLYNVYKIYSSLANIRRKHSSPPSTIITFIIKFINTEAQHREKRRKMYMVHSSSRNWRGTYAQFNFYSDSLRCTIISHRTKINK